jgi:predicted helicase
VWYTPEPVVDFIVRAVDDVLKTEFGLVDGLADTSKITVDWDTGQDDPKTGKPRTIRKDVHKVQILDPATGTGTFLAKAVQLISDRVKARAPGKWSNYVEEDLPPRLHGFELLMASYAMCHMKLDMMLDQTGYKPSAKPPRLSVWLTNALEPAEREVKDLFFQPLAEEARGASEVKRQTPIMCVIGNPPYSGESANKGNHIMALMDAYKKEPGGKQKLKERNSKWINDDYVKFIRAAEDLIARNPSGGVLGFITNHGYLDNPTFRGMRWHLLKTFDKIWVLDLHGNSKKKEVAPDGSPDKNVFDIQQGVAIVIAMRLGHQREEIGKVYRTDLWGSRAGKNEGLWSGSLEASSLSPVEITLPHLGFLQRDHGVSVQYNAGVSIPELFKIGGTGVVTKRDNLTIHHTKAKVWEAVQDFLSKPEWEVRNKYSLPADVRDWRYEWAKDDLEKNASEAIIHPISYRPFDDRFIYNSGQSRGFVGWPVEKVMGHFNAGSNIGICTARSNKNPSMDHFFITSKMMETKYAESSTQSAVFPLYRYPLHNQQSDAFESAIRTPNLDPKLYRTICKAAGIDPADQAEPDDEFRAAAGDARPSEVKVFDYIYGVLHAPAYREMFAEFLKIGFPRIPYPPSPEVFRHVSEKGEQLRRLHLMEVPAIGDTPYPFHGEGDDVVASGFPKFEGGQVKINPDQFFASVPDIAWNFHIGGYQPAQKWLKDRRGRSLSWDDIGHYQKIVKILSETDRIMKEIELPLETA